VNARPRFYNPREASPEVLEAMLVGRQPIVEEILADLARQAGAATRQHWLIRGPRGIGKTHLIGIVYHRVKKEPRLGAYLPVWLAESEAYSVYSAAILLLQVAQQLVVELHQSGDPGSRTLQARIAELEHGGDEPALFEELVQLLREEAHSRGKILLVLMENLDAALAGLPGRRGTGQVQRLRSLLSEDKELLFLSTTPTRYLAALLDPRQPLYGQLKERTLQPLTEDEVGELLARLAEMAEQPTKAGFEGPEPEFRVRRRVLHRLTGGSPRAVVMAFSVLTGNPGVQAIVEEMSDLLDAQTAYFEARLAQLAPRERAVVAAMALAPENLTLKEISARSRLPLRALSTQVKRLQDQGFVVPVAGERGKGTLYELGDGLFRLWYQFRKGTRILSPIVRFLALWHPVDELEEALFKLRLPGGERSLLQHDLIVVTVRQMAAAVEFGRSETGRNLREALWQECAIASQTDAEEQALRTAIAVAEAPTAEDFEKLQALLAKLTKGPGAEPSPVERVLWAMLGSIAFQLRRYKEADTYLERFLNSPSPFDVKTPGAAVQLMLALVRENQGREPEALDGYRGFYQLFAGVDSDWSIFALTKILFAAIKRGDSEEIESCSTKLLDHLQGGTQLFKNVPLLPFVLRGAFPSRPTLTFVDVVARVAKAGTLWPKEVRQVLTELSATADSDSSEPARFYRLVLNVVTAKVHGHQSQARRALARVPAELRQTVAELADRLVAAEQQAHGIGESQSQASASEAKPPKKV